MVASGALSLEDAYKAVDLDTITLLLGDGPHACVTGSSPVWVQACATARRTRSAQRPLPRQGGGTGSRRRRLVRTSARRRCRYITATRSPGRRSAGPRPELPSR